MEVDQAVAAFLDALQDKIVGSVAIGLGIKDLRVARLHRDSHRRQRFRPCPFIARAGKQAEYAGASGFLVLKQQVGHSGIGRNDKHAVVEFPAVTVSDQHIGDNGLGVGNRCTANFFDSPFHFNAPRADRAARPSPA